jgi:hypothetical protein
MEPAERQQFVKFLKKHGPRKLPSTIHAAVEMAFEAGLNVHKKRNAELEAELNARLQDSYRMSNEAIAAKKSIAEMESAGKYTLDQLAWFNRCLFPDDFAQDMHKVGGMNGDLAFALQLNLRSKIKRTGQSLNVLDIYQDYALPDSEFQQGLENVLVGFFKKSKDVE